MTILERSLIDNNLGSVKCLRMYYPTENEKLLELKEFVQTQIKTASLTIIKPTIKFTQDAKIISKCAEIESKAEMTFDDIKLMFQNLNFYVDLTESQILSNFLTEENPELLEEFLTSQKKQK